MNTIGSIIRLKRKEKGLKQKDLAALLHVSAVAVSKWENGKNLPDFGNLQALSVLLEIPMPDLLEGLSLPGRSLPEPPENPALQSQGSPEPSDAAIPDVEDTASLKTPLLPVSQLEDVSEHPLSVKIRRKMKIAVPFLTFLLAGSIAVCWIGVRMKNKAPSFTVYDAYYGDYNGEYVYYVITEVESDPDADELLNFNEMIREKYGEYFSAVDKIVIIYAQDYTDYIENGFNDNTDAMGVILPLPE